MEGPWLAPLAEEAVAGGGGFPASAWIEVEEGGPVVVATVVARAPGGR